MKLPDSGLQFVSQTHSTGTAISGCLGQTHEGIFYLSLSINRKLNAAKRYYSAVELDALVMIFAITRLKRYLIGRQFVIQSDNQPLRVITSGIKKNARTARWALILQDCEFI